MVAAILGCAVLHSYYDIAVAAEELVEVYVLAVDLEKRLLRRDLDDLSGLAHRTGTNRREDTVN
jgi:hypothetical protein